MPPRSSRVPSKGTSLDKKLQTAFKEFAQHIKKSKKGSGSITVPISVNTIKDILKIYRKDTKTINQMCVATFITELDIVGDNVFNLLDPPTTCVVLDAILQTEACREAERGLHLLAASLFQGLENSADNQDLDNRKDAIGTQCLKLLLDFFVDDQNNFAMRRWAGFLCIQLIKDCESNLETLALMSEESRRSIGRKLVEEPDEILKVIYGYLIRAIIKEETPIETLFPTDYDKTVYADFPLSTQGNTGWGLQFQDYIDNLYMKNQTVEPPEEIGAFFFATSVHLVPKRQLGTSHHNTNLFVDDSQITILAPSHEGQFDSILDIPLSLIKKMKFATDQTSQVDSHCISLDLSKAGDEVCYLDSKRITVNTVIFSMVSNCSDRFRSMILHSEQNIEIIEEGRLGTTPSPRTTQSQGSKKVSSTQLTGSDGSPELIARPGRNSSGRPVTQMQSQSQTKISHTTFSGSEDLPESEEPATGNPTRKRLGKADSEVNNNFPRCLGGSENSDVEDQETVEDHDGKDTYGANPKNARPNVSAPDASAIKARPAPMRGRGVKPKAKPPINVRHSTGNQGPAENNKPVSQSARSKQDIQAVNEDYKLGRRSKASSQAKAKLDVKKTSGDIVDRAKFSKTANKDVSQKVALAKKQQGSVGQSGISQKTGTGRTANSRKSAASQSTKAVDQLTDDSITSPDANNASTPKAIKYIKPISKPIKPMAKTMGSQAARLKVDAPVSGEPKAKRYGLPKPTTDIPSDIFDMPDDEEEPREIKKAKKGTAKPKSKPPPPPPPATRAKQATTAAATRTDANKRQSAPAALQRTATQIRRSQRAAASKAEDKMLGADESHDEYEVEVEEPRKTTAKGKSEAVQCDGSNIQQDTTKLPESKKTVAKPDLLSAADVEDSFQLQAQDARSLNLPHNSAIDIDQDIYDATPQKPSNKASKIVILKKASLFSSVGHKKARSSGLDLADKLGNSFEGLDTESEPQETTSQKLIIVEEDVVHSRSKITKNQEGDHPAAASALGKGKTSHRSGDEDAPGHASPQGPGTDPSRMDLEASTILSPPPATPTSYTTACLVHECRTDEPRNPDLFNESVPVRETEVQLEEQVSTGSPKHVPEPTLKAPSSNIDDIAPSPEIETVAQPKEAMDAPNQEPVLDGQPIKRKAAQVDPIPSKRRRSDKYNIEKTLEPAHESVQNEVSATSSKDLRQPKVISPMRKSPRLAARVNDISDTMKKVDPEKPLVNKELDRKPQVIAFGAKGPRNQGMTGIVDAHDTRKSAANSKDTSLTVDCLIERKRKWEDANLSGTISPQKKKQNISPTDLHVGDDLDNDNHPGFESSPLAPEAKSKPIRQRVLSRPSSQASRVDFNGSPIAADSPVDHMGKLKDRLADPRAEKELPGEATASPRVRRASEIFGPKISLGIKSKARPSSPEQPNSRYIPHEKTNHGSYNEVNSKQVVEPKKNLIDPFVERTRKSNDFTKRLRRSASKENAVVHNATRPRNVSQESPSLQAHGAAARRHHHTEQELPKLPRETIKVKPRETHAAHRSEKRYHVSERAMVDAKSRQLYDDSIPSDMISDTSNKSRSSDSARTPLQEMVAPNEMYNVALRPHYQTFNQAIHRIADEVIIRLAGQEEKMDLLVEQYKDYGTKILDSEVEKREHMRAVISDKFDKKKSEMVSAYSEAKDVIMETAESLRENPTIRFEKEWRKNQEGIRKQIAERRKTAGN